MFYFLYASVGLFLLFVAAIVVLPVIIPVLYFHCAYLLIKFNELRER